MAGSSERGERVKRRALGRRPSSALAFLARLRLRDPVLAQVVAEVARIDAEEQRGFLLAALRLHEGALDDLLLGGAEVPAQVELARSLRRGERESGFEDSAEEGRVELAVAGEDHRALEHVAELAHVAGPSVGAEHVQRFGGQGRTEGWTRARFSRTDPRARPLLPRPRQEVLDDLGDVLLMLAH